MYKLIEYKANGAQFREYYADSITKLQSILRREMKVNAEEETHSFISHTFRAFKTVETELTIQTEPRIPD